MGAKKGVLDAWKGVLVLTDEGDYDVVNHEEILPDGNVILRSIDPEKIMQPDKIGAPKRTISIALHVDENSNNEVE